jgi:hypothetical protein
MKVAAIACRAWSGSGWSSARQFGHDFMVAGHSLPQWRQTTVAERSSTSSTKQNRHAAVVAGHGRWQDGHQRTAAASSLSG